VCEVDTNILDVIKITVICCVPLPILKHGMILKVYTEWWCRYNVQTVQSLIRTVTINILCQQNKCNYNTNQPSEC